MPYRRPLPGAWLDPDCPLDWSHPLNRGLVGEWSVIPNDGWRGGVTFRDLVRGGKCPHDGTLTNRPTWQGPRGTPGGYGSLGFVSASSQQVTAPVPSALLSGGFTLTLAIVGTLAAGTGSGLGTSGTTYAANYGGASENILVTWTHTSPNYDGAVTMSGNGGYPVVTWATKPAAGQPVVVTITWDTATIRGYLDGAPQGSVANVTFGTVTSPTLCLGSGNGARYWDGSLVGTLLHGRPLSAAEVGELVRETRRGNPDRWNWAKPSPKFFFVAPPPGDEGRIVRGPPPRRIVGGGVPVRVVRGSPPRRVVR